MKPNKTTAINLKPIFDRLLSPNGKFHLTRIIGEAFSLKDPKQPQYNTRIKQAKLLDKIGELITTRRTKYLDLNDDTFIDASETENLARKDKNPKDISETDIAILERESNNLIPIPTPAAPTPTPIPAPSSPRPTSPGSKPFDLNDAKQQFHEMAKQISDPNSSWYQNTPEVRRKRYLDLVDLAVKAANNSQDKSQIDHFVKLGNKYGKYAYHTYMYAAIKDGNLKIDKPYDLKFAKDVFSTMDEATKRNSPWYKTDPATKEASYRNLSDYAKKVKDYIESKSPQNTNDVQLFAQYAGHYDRATYIASVYNQAQSGTLPTVAKKEDVKELDKVFDTMDKNIKHKKSGWYCVDLKERKEAYSHLIASAQAALKVLNPTDPQRDKYKDLVAQYTKYENRANSLLA